MSLTYLQKHLTKIPVVLCWSLRADEDGSVESYDPHASYDSTESSGPSIASLAGRTTAEFGSVELAQETSSRLNQLFLKVG